MTPSGEWNLCAALLLLLLVLASPALAQTPSPAFLVIEKEDQKVVIVDPASLKIVARVPVGADPHEICVSSDGKTAYITASTSIYRLRMRISGNLPLYKR